MANAGGCLFRIGYFLYTRTRVGYYYHQKDIKKAKDKLGDSGHSDLKEFTYGHLTVVPIPMLMDNYSYLVTDTKSGKSVIIDPGHAQPVQKVLAQKNIEPDAILVTHKHWDHSGGNSDMKEAFPGIPVYGGEDDNVPDCTHPLPDGASLRFGDLDFRILLTPGHTVGHVVYLLQGAGGVPDMLFSGDCLFLGGIGRMFEAPPATMLESLDKLMDLSPDTLLWPGHEYAKDNLEFASSLEPDNCDIQTKIAWTDQMRESHSPTCPSTLREERLYNPFLRTSERSILQAVGMVEGGLTEGGSTTAFAKMDSQSEIQENLSSQTRAQVLGIIRERKDKFKYKL